MKKKTFLLPFCLLMLCFSSEAQTFYELNYVSPGNEHISPVTALLVRFSDGNGYVRVKYFDSTEKKAVVINMDIADVIPEISVTGSMPDTFTVNVSNPKTIIPLKEMSHIPDHYLFRIDPATGFAEPWKVISSDNTKKQTGFSSIPVIIQPTDITPRYVQNFFRKEEPFFQYVLGADHRDLNNLPGKGITMYLLIVADIGDESIGIDCTKDYQNLVSTYSKIAAQIGVRLDTLSIMGPRYSKSNVEKALKNLHPAGNDIVIFHYTGHGFNTDLPDKKFPNIFLQTSKKYKSEDLPKISLNIEDVYQTIINKGARLNFVFSDCCNNILGSKPKKSDIDPNRGGVLDINPEKCKTLFIDQQASVLATAAQKGELSRSNETVGGYFTSNFVTQLNELLSPVYNPYVKITWDGILGKTKEVTLQKLRRCYDEDAINCKCVMNPFFVINPAKTN